MLCKILGHSSEETQSLAHDSGQAVRTSLQTMICYWVMLLLGLLDGWQTPWGFPWLECRLSPYLCMQSALATPSRRLRHMRQPTACTTAQPWYGLLLACYKTCTTPDFSAADSAILISCRLDSLDLQVGFGNHRCTGNNCW